MEIMKLTRDIFLQANELGLFNAPDKLGPCVYRWLTEHPELLEIATKDPISSKVLQRVETRVWTPMLARQLREAWGKARVAWAMRRFPDVCTRWFHEAERLGVIRQFSEEFDASHARIAKEVYFPLTPYQ